MSDDLNTPEMIRATLKRLVSQHGETYAALSRMIRRGDHYLAKFVREGTPKRLAEKDSALLAAYFWVDPRVLGGKRSIFQKEPERRLFPGSLTYKGTRRSG